jgi:hypothetical protein
VITGDQSPYKKLAIEDACAQALRLASTAFNSSDIASSRVFCPSRTSQL